MIFRMKPSDFFSGVILGLTMLLQPAGSFVTEKITNLKLAKNFQYQDELERLYDLSDDQLIWSKSGSLTEQSFDAIQSLQQSSLIGLNPEKYSPEQLLKSWHKLTNQISGDPSDLTEFDIRLSISLMQFISDLHIGRIDPHEIGFNVVVSEKRIDLVEIIIAYSRSNNMWEAIQRLEPKFKAYQRLKKALIHYRQLVENHKWLPLLADKTIHPSDPYQDLNVLKHILIAVGDLDLNIATNEIYDDEVVNAVKRFQRRHGLEDDGLIGRKTFLQLNTPLSKRVEQIELAMERLRWLPEPGDGPHIVVNIPAFELYAFHIKNAVETIYFKMGVVVGSALDKYETPVFMADMKYLVFRPYWNVPYSIVVKELLPRMKQNPHYLYKHNYEILEGHTIISTVFFDQDMVSGLRSGKLRIRQRPGESNALGLIKFIFPNSNSVYLHDTPSKRLFGESRRDFSHGCIRVEDPSGLAEFVLGFQGQDWDSQAIDIAVQGDNDQKVILVNQIPVHIFYTTAAVRENGEIAFFDDIYGHDKRLSQLLKSSVN